MKASFLAVLAVATILAPFATANAQAPSGAQNGKKVFEKLGCVRCHGSAGEGMTGIGSGPPKIAATHLSLPEFVGAVRNPKGQMPPFGAKQVSDAELSDVYAFLQSIASQPKLELPASANSENGKRFYTSFGCYECHGLQGQGSTQTGGARLGPPGNRPAKCRPTLPRPSPTLNSRTSMPFFGPFRKPRRQRTSHS